MVCISLVCVGIVQIEYIVQYSIREAKIKLYCAVFE